MKFPTAIICLALTSASLTGTTLYPSGVTSSAGLSLTDLTNDGWSVVYNELYSSPTQASDPAAWQAAAGTGNLFMGAIDLQGNVLLGGTGGAEVLTVTSSTSTASSYASSNLFWYNIPVVSSNVGSVGFAGVSSVNLNQADASNTASDLRLSWHLNDGIAPDHGGYRIGSTEGLNDSDSFRKIVLVAPSAGVPDGGSTFALLGLTMAGIIRLRRKTSSI